VIVGRGWNENDWDEKKFPDKHSLKDFAMPIMLKRQDGHSCWLNQAALDLFKITKDTVAPEGGVIDKDEKTGEPTGIIREWAIAIIKDYLSVVKSALIFVF
jgi:predicted amidohydrolase YtcJ